MHFRGNEGHERSWMEKRERCKCPHTQSQEINLIKKETSDGLSLSYMISLGLYWAYWKKGSFSWSPMAVGQFRTLLLPQGGHKNSRCQSEAETMLEATQPANVTVSMVLQTPNPTVLSLCQWSWLILVCSSKAGLSISQGVLITSGPSPILVKSLLSCGNRSWQFCMLVRCAWLQGKNNAFVFLSGTLSQHEWYLLEENSFIFISAGLVSNASLVSIEEDLHLRTKGWNKDGRNLTSCRTGGKINGYLHFYTSQWIYLNGWIYCLHADRLWFGS